MSIRWQVELEPGQVERGELLASVAGATDCLSGALARLLADRYSCRAFREEVVPKERIEKWLRLGQLSPSWCNSQPWQIDVLSGSAATTFAQALHAHASSDKGPRTPDFAFPQTYSGVYQTRRRETAARLYESLEIEPGDRAASGKQALENFRLFGAPHVLIITSEQSLGTYGAVDCGVFLGNLLTIAQSMGLATIAQAALAAYPDFVREHLGLPDSRRVVCGVSFGYADPDHPANRFRTARAGQEATVRFTG